MRITLYFLAETKKPVESHQNAQSKSSTEEAGYPTPASESKVEDKKSAETENG